MRTCDRCLDGRHRCLTTECACSCNTARRSPRMARPVTPRARRSTAPRKAPKVTGRKPGRPRIHPVKVPVDPAVVEAERLARQVAAVERVRSQSVAATVEAAVEYDRRALLARLEAEAAGNVARPRPTCAELDTHDKARAIHGIAEMLRTYQLTGALS